MKKNLSYKLKTGKINFLVPMTLFLSFLFFVNHSFASANSLISQQINEKTVTVKMSNVPIKDILYSIQKQSGISFAYDDKELSQLKNMSVNLEKVTVKQALDQILKSTPFTYKIIDKGISIYKKVAANAAKIEVRGKVIDQEGKAIAGATIIVAGTSTGAITDNRGSFVLSMNPGEEIEISYVGKKEIKKLISSAVANLVITLEDDALSMEEVVVTGYQKLSKERVTGSFEAVGKEQLNKPSTSLEQRLIGSVSGIQVVDNGYRERTESIVIRGVTSLGANSNPLIIVDGFAIEGSLSSINPNDIENITVLKDAAAASIWGARSANGVIVVTTKSAVKGKVNVDVNAFVKFSGKLDLDYANPLASSRETVEYERMGFKSNFFGGSTLPLENVYSNKIYNDRGKMYSQAVMAMNESRLGYFKGDLEKELERLSNLDNRDQIKDYLLQAPVTQQYNVSISGGSEKMSNVLTLMYEDGRNYYKRNNDKRYSLNYRTNLSLFKWLDFNFSAMVQYDNNRYSGTTLAEIQNLSPYDMLVDDQGDYLHVQNGLYMPAIERFITNNGVQFPYSDWSYNPIQEMESRNMREKLLNGRFQAGLNVKLMKGLTFDSKIQYEIMEGKTRELYEEDSYDVRFKVNYNSEWNGKKESPVNQNLANGQHLKEGNSSLDAYNFRNQFSFDRVFGDHNVSVIVGTEVSNRLYQTINYGDLYGYNDLQLSSKAPLNGVSTPSNPLYNMFGAGTTIGYPVAKRSYSVDKFFSIYANGAYTFQSKYTLSGSYRTDASNLISSDPSIRYSPFWSVGGSWQVGNEKFMEKVAWVDRLILRATYGFNGNVDKSTSVDPLISIWGENQQTGTGYGVISNYGNPSLGWEKTGSLNIGIDYAFLNNKLFGKIDYYNKQGRDLISMVALANVYGTDSQSINAVSMYNKGVEITIGTNLRKNKFAWNGNLTIAYNKNKITKLFKDDATLNNRVYGAGSGWQYTEGYDANAIWAFKYGGVRDLGGVTQPTIVDKNGENPRTLNSSSTSFNSKNYLVDAGTSVAPYVIGFNNSFRYSNLSLSFIVTGYFGHKFKRTGFNYPTMRSTLVGAANVNKYYSEVKNGSSSEFIPISEKGGSTYSTQLSYAPLLENMVVSAANIRFQEINLTYDLPRYALKKIGLSELSVYAQLNNVGVIVFNKYKQDPFYPMGSEKPGISYTFGLKLKF